MKSWSARIYETGNAMDLLSLAREYLDGWDPGALAALPEQARPQRIKGVDDLAYWHQRLVDVYCTGQLRGIEIEKVRDMLQFFAFANQRAEELEGLPVEGYAAAERLFSDRSVPKLFTSALTGAAEH